MLQTPHPILTITSAVAASIKFWSCNTQYRLDVTLITHKSKCDVLHITITTAIDEKGTLKFTEHDKYKIIAGLVWLFMDVNETSHAAWIRVKCNSSSAQVIFANLKRSVYSLQWIKDNFSKTIFIAFKIIESNVKYYQNFF